MKKIIKYLLFILLITTGILAASGKLYYYKALVYNFVDIDDLNLFHNREVKNGTGLPWNFSTDYNKKNLTDTLTALLEANKSVAFLIVKNDSICFEKYWEDYGQQSLSNSFSMAKSIVALLIGKAIDEGKIKSLDQPVADFIPEFKDGEKSKITIRHLMMMSSGLDWNEGYSSLTSQVTVAYYGTELYKQVTSLGVAEVPGKFWEYKSCDSELLAIIVNKATGKSVAAYASEKLWKPLGAEHSAQWSLDHKDGLEKAYCCFYSNARDFARFGKLMLQHGRWNDTQIIDSAFIHQCITPNNLPNKEDNKPVQHYGYQWWLSNISNHPVYYMRGILGQYVIVIPDMQMIIVRLGHKRSNNPDGKPNDYKFYAEQVIKMFE